MNKSVLIIAFISISLVAKDYEAELLINTNNTQIGDLSLDEFSGSVNIINVDNASKNINDYLEESVGVNVRESGSLGGLSTVSIRGASPKQVAVYLDGFLLNTSSMGFFDLSDLDLSYIKRIEVYKGSIPVNLGVGAVGGAINLISNRKHTKNSIAFDFNSIGLMGLRTVFSQDKFILSAKYSLTPNNFVFLNDNGTEYNSRDDTKEIRHNNQELKENLLLKYILVDRSNLKIEPSIVYTKKLQNLPTWNNLYSPQTSLDTETYVVNLVLEYISIISSKVNLSYQNFKERYQDKLGLIGLGKQDNTYTTRTISYKHYLEYLGVNYTIKTNLLLKHETYTDYDYIQNTELNRHNRLAFVPSFELDYKFNTLRINPSLIYEYYKDTDTSSYKFIEPRLGLLYDVAENFSVFVNIARYYRIPTFYELYGDRGFLLGNTTLKAEQGINLDLGFKYKLGKRLNLAISCFNNSVANVISYVYDARGIGKAINIAQASISGVESELKYKINDILVMLSYTKQSPIVSEGIYKTLYLPGRYTDSLFLKIVHHLFGKANEELKLWYSYTYRTGLFYDAVNILDSIPQHIISLGMQYRFKSTFLNVNINNLLNKNYQDYHRDYTAGFVASLSLGVEF